MISVIAHRGASRARPENTLEAFLEARRMGAHAVELDVRRSRDGALVVHHDARVAGHDDPICAESAAALPPEVPLLDAALDTCRGMWVNIEIKNVPGEPDFDPDDALAAAVAALVVERDLVEQVVVSCFHLPTVDAVRAAEAAIPTAWLTLADWDQHRAVRLAAQHGHAALHPHHAAVTAELVAEAHALGLRVNTWTVDDPDRMRELAAAGVDGIVTNVPDVALAVLGRGE